MNKTKQFLTLFKFQATTNPFIFFLLFGFDAPLFIPYLLGENIGNYHASLSSLLFVQNLFMLALAGLFILAPEMGSPGANNPMAAGTDFLLTRAIDRPILYRARVAFLYFLVLVIPLLNLAYTLRNPGLMVTEYSKVAQQLCLHFVPGTSLVPDPSGNRWPLISMVNGNVLIESWHVWIFAMATLAVQPVLLLLYPLKHRLFIFYALFVGAIFGMLFFQFHHLRDSMPSFTERLFFAFAAHTGLFWVFTVLIFMGIQFLCERRFASMEQ